MRVLKVIGISVLAVIVLGIISLTIYVQYDNWKRNQKGDYLIQLEATFMQYACGDENDDMKVEAVPNSQYNFIIGKDIDPELADQSSSSYLKEYFYENKSDTFGMTYRLSGRLSKYPEFGCDQQAPLFWISTIEMLDGRKKETFANKP